MKIAIKRTLLMLLMVMMVVALVPGMSMAGKAYAAEQCTITFDSGGGFGSMGERHVDVGTEYELPRNGFIPPEGKTFSNWRIGSEDYEKLSKYVVNEDTVITAVWKDTGPVETVANLNIQVDMSAFTNFAVGKTAGEANDQLHGSSCVISTGTEGTYNSLSGNSLTYKSDDWWNHCTTSQVISSDNEYAIYVDAFALKEGYDFLYPVKFASHTPVSEIEGFTVSVNGENREDVLLYYNPDYGDYGQLLAAYVPIGKPKAPEGQHAVTFELQGGTMSGSTVQMVADGECAIKPADPTNGGLKFDGWYTSEDYTDEFDFTKSITRDTTIYAKFLGVFYAKIWDVTEGVEDHNTNGYIMNMDNANFSTVMDVVFILGKPISVKVSPFKMYKFLGWRDGSPDGPSLGTDELFTYTPTVADHMHEIYALIEKVPVYTVSFDAGEGTGTMAPVEVERDTYYELPANAFTSPEDKVFEMWDLGNPGDSIYVNTNLTVTARWKDKAPEDVFHTVTFVPNGGDMPEPLIKSIKEGDSVPQPAAMTNGEFSFWGWYTDPGFADGTMYDFSSAVTGDITLYARWVGNIYAIAYDVKNNAENKGGMIYDGRFYASPNDVIFTIGQDIKLTAYPDPHYTFKEWRYGTPDGAVLGTEPELTYTTSAADNNTNIFAIFENDGMLKVTFAPGEGTGDPYDNFVDAGTDYVLPGSSFIPPEGKTFSHWQKGSAKFDKGSTCRIDEETVFVAIYKDTGPVEIVDTVDIVLDLDSLTKFTIGHTAGEVNDQITKDGFIRVETPGCYTENWGNDFIYLKDGAWNHGVPDELSKDNEYGVFINAIALNEGYDFAYPVKFAFNTPVSKIFGFTVKVNGVPRDDVVLFYNPDYSKFGQVLGAYVPIGKPGDAPEPVPVTDVTRYFGATRYETAIRAADAYKAQLEVDMFNAVIIACGTNYADALAGSYLSAVKHAPILLVRNTPGEIQLVQDYIKKNLKHGGMIYMLGGEAVVPDSAVAGLRAYDIKRLWGSDRYETNVKILQEAGVSGDEILVASGIGFADSLSASATGKPILLVKNTIQDSQKDYVASLKGKKFYVIGGTGAVNEDLEAYFKTLGETERLGGQTRYETSVNVAKQFFPEPNGAVLAYGANFPDGLCGGSLANAMGGPLLLAANGKADKAAAYAKEKGVKGGAVLGGPTLISDADARTIFRMAADAKIEEVK